jgi:hypothetical protein
VGEGGRGEVLVLIVGGFLGWQERRGSWGRGSRDVHAPVVGKFAGEGAEERS